MFQLLKFDVKGLRVISGTRTEPADQRKELHNAMKDVGASPVAAR